MRNQNKMSIIISAPSGAGKTTIINLLLKQEQFDFSISTTTRPKRDHEIEGESYYFTSKDTFKEQINQNDFLEWAIVHDNYYGTSKKEIDRIIDKGKIPIFDIDVQGAAQIKGQLPGALFIFIVPPSIKELEKRLRNRKTDSEDQIKTRLNNAILELKQYANYDYVVVNQDIQTTVDTISAIVNCEQYRTEYQTELIEKILEEQYDYPIK